MELKEFRSLKGNDVFTVSRIIKKMNLSIEVKEGDSQEQVGARFILSVFENLHEAQKEVNDFLGSMIGISGKTFGELPLSEYLAYLQKFKEIEGLADFLEHARKQTK